MTDRTLSRIEGFRLAVRDPEASARFYCEGLGFDLAGVDGQDRIVQLADVGIRLARTPERVMPPPPRSADAPDFQHFAIRVRDMGAAFARLSALSPTAISRGGPQRLPPADGSVTAWKFRDPDGHPLELLQFPHASAAGPLFEAIDHTALACSDVQASLAFYTQLGLRQGSSSHNRGVTQDRLDGLGGVDLHIATVHTAAAGPHIELLHYVQSGAPPGLASNLSPSFISTLAASHAPPTRLRDPDGHVLDLS